jgi:hypothetical protein
MILKWLVCLFTGHNWTRWKYVRSVGRYDEVLKRNCKRCSRMELYKGLTESTITGDKIPFGYEE